MLDIDIAESLPPAVIRFLRHCYKFVNEEWAHTIRQQLPDQGFERSFRASCTSKLLGWDVSQGREMGLGSALQTASGVLHEIDVVARNPETTALMELKHRLDPPGKNDVIIFFAKIIDYIAHNPGLLLQRLCPIFMSTSPFDHAGLTACLGLGIHPVGPGLRPFPLLVNNTRIIEAQLRNGVTVSEDTQHRFRDFCAELASVSLHLSSSWLNQRLHYYTDTTVIVRACSVPDPQVLSHSLLRLNGECASVLSSVREASR